VDADLVVLKGDPAQDIRALADVQYTLRAGRMVYRAAA
jgi:imidazolonepropionase-like amidohydrolase